MAAIDVSAGVRQVLHCLNRNEIPYMIVGSIAGAVYGEPRLTRDIDLVVQTSGLRAAAILNAFDPVHFYVPPEEIVTQEISRRGQFNLLHHASGLKVDCIFIKATPHAEAEFSRRTMLEILPGLHGWLATPEDIIIKKLAYYREGQSEKHITDIRGIIANSSLDKVYLTGWIERLKLQTEWQRCDSQVSDC